MTTQAITRLKALILVMVALFLAQKILSGDLYYYIGPRFSWLVTVGAVLFALLATSYNLFQRPKAEQVCHDHEHEKQSVWNLLIMALPLLLGVLIPARPLGASAFANRGAATDLGLAPNRSLSRLSVTSSERNILDWASEINANSDPAALNGQQADVTGFVVRDPSYGEDQFLVGRFVIWHCVADARAVGLVVQAENASEFKADSWVRVKGKFTVGQLGGETSPILITEEIIPIEPPEQPYLYQ